LGLLSRISNQPKKLITPYKRSPLTRPIAAINTALNREKLRTVFRISGADRHGYDVQLLPRGRVDDNEWAKMCDLFEQRPRCRRTELAQPMGETSSAYANQTRAGFRLAFEFAPPRGTEVFYESAWPLDHSYRRGLGGVWAKELLIDPFVGVIVVA